MIIERIFFDQTTITYLHQMILLDEFPKSSKIFLHKTKAQSPFWLHYSFFKDLVVSERWNDLSESMKNIAIVNQFKNKGHISLLLSHLAKRESIKMHTDASKVTEGRVNFNSRTKHFSLFSTPERSQKHKFLQG